MSSQHRLHPKGVPKPAQHGCRTDVNSHLLAENGKLMKENAIILLIWEVPVRDSRIINHPGDLALDTRCPQTTFSLLYACWCSALLTELRREVNRISFYNRREGRENRIMMSNDVYGWKPLRIVSTMSIFD